MLSLSIFSSSKRISVAIYENNNLLKLEESNMMNTKNEVLFRVLQRIFVKFKIKKISKIFFSTGPGSFTAIRSIKAIAQGISAVTNSKIYSINMFDIFIKQISLKNNYILIFFSSGKETVFFRLFESNKEKFLPISEILFGTLDKFVEYYLIVCKEYKNTQLFTNKETNFTSLKILKKTSIKTLEINAKTLGEACLNGFLKKDLNIYYHHTYYEKP
ncbi:MAG: hypothetical protein CMM99_01785 [Rickettsiales bacterium]|nr:hypothetical protein [Rickettsiales bacterium]